MLERGWMVLGLAAHLRNSGFYSELGSHWRGSEQRSDRETEWSGKGWKQEEFRRSLQKSCDW